MTTWRGPVSLLLALAAVPPALAAPSRAKSLAQFDNGYAQCEKRDRAMRGHRDQVYASLYRLKFDDALRAQLEATRSSAPYKQERRRAQQTLAKSALTHRQAPSRSSARASMDDTPWDPSIATT